MNGTIVCLASYEKGADLLLACADLGMPPVLVTVEKLKDAEWPRDRLGGFYWLADFHTRDHVIHAVSWLARSQRIARIVALDEFDLELAAALREHLRVPGMGDTAVRYFRDKLAMRQRAAAAGMRVPRFTAVFNDEDVRAFAGRVAPPWLLKPRTEAAAIGIRRITDETALWAELEQLGDRRSWFLLEEYVGGAVYHVDSIVARRSVTFAMASRYSTPPFDVAHGGGIFASTTVTHGSADEKALLEHNTKLVSAFGIVGGALHTEFIRSDADGGFLFLETAARVGGAHIVEMVEAATGVNLWREWAAVEVASARGQPYTPPLPHTDHAGLVLSLARQEWPDTSAYDDPEIVWRIRRRHHAGLIVSSPDPERVGVLLEAYRARFAEDFLATMPAPDKPTA